MKRQKRDMSERAHLKGYSAGFHGRNRDACPHATGESRSRWLSGWSQGRQDQWDGLNENASQQKLQAAF